MTIGYPTEPKHQQNNTDEYITVSKLYPWYRSKDGQEMIFGTSPPKDSKLFFPLPVTDLHSSNSDTLDLDNEIIWLRDNMVERPIYDIASSISQKQGLLIPEREFPSLLSDGVEFVFQVDKAPINSYNLEPVVGTLSKNPTEEVAAFYRDVVRKDEHLLKLFMKKLPNVDLHLHIDGSIPSRQLLNMAVADELFCKVIKDNYKQGSYRFEFGTESELSNKESSADSPIALNGRVITARELQQDKNLREKFYESVSMRGAKAQSSSGHSEHFFKAFDTLESIAKHFHLKDKLTELLKNMDDRVIYRELSIWFEKDPIPEDFKKEFSKVFDSDGMNSETAKKLMEHASLKQWVKKYVTDAKKILDECKTVTDPTLLNRGFSADDLFDLDNPCVVRFIIDNDRTIPCLATVFAHFVGSWTLQSQDDRVVGSGFAGKEHDDDALNKVYDQLHTIGVLKDEDCFINPKCSPHSGELNRQLSQSEDYLQNCVRQAIFVAGADRIGHGVAITEDPAWLELMDAAKALNIHFEVCVMSNEHVVNVTNGTHPINWFMKKNVPFSLCTDDQGVLCSSLPNEYANCAERYEKFDYKQQKRSIILAMLNSFLPGKAIYKTKIVTRTVKDKDGILRTRKSEVPVLDKDGNLTLINTFMGESGSLSNIHDIIISCLDLETGEWNNDVFDMLTSDQKQFLRESQRGKMQIEMEKELIYFEHYAIPKMKRHLSY